MDYVFNLIKMSFDAVGSFLVGVFDRGEKIKEMKAENERLKAAIKNLEEKLPGERKCGEYCHICKHSFVKNQGISIVPVYGCILDCDCNDFDMQ